MKFLWLAGLLLISTVAHAAWITSSGHVLQVFVYPNTDSVLFKLDTTGTATGCADATLFAVDGAVTADRRKQLVAALMSAQARDATVSVAYADSGGCIGWDASSNVYRAVTRIIIN